MKMITDIMLGVDDYCLSSIKKCSKNPEKNVSITLSFSLAGNFLKAAISDSLAHTVDYDRLCGRIHKALSRSDCECLLDIAERTTVVIREFSPLITGGYLRIALLCHDTFIEEKRLL